MHKWRILNEIQNLNITVLVYFITPPPHELKKKFSDGFRWFEFEWGILRAELQTQFCLVKSRKPKEILGFSKNFQTGLGVLSSRGGGNKVDENGKGDFFKKKYNFMILKLFFVKNQFSFFFFWYSFLLFY